MKTFVAVALAALAVLGANADLCDRMCTADYTPVCASNGRTYGNRCLAEQAACRLGLTLTMTEGECAPLDCGEVCTAEADPVCGTDGVTYTNECELARHACQSFVPIAVLHKGACVEADCPVVCTEEYAPLCTAGGMTFGNLCQLFAGRCRGKAFEPGALDIAHVGRCLPEDCPRACAKVNRKVCTSDGQTFANECELRKENCRLGLAVLAEKEGECETSPCAAVTCPANTRCVPTRQECFKEPCPQYECAPLDAEDACSTVCPANYAPVCGSDLQTYGNECELLAAACRARIGGLTEINVLHVGECTDADRAAADCAAMCPMLYAPVCGTDLNTYGNECELQAAACRARANGLAEFTVLHEGECTDADLAGSAGSAPIWQEPAFIGSMVLLAVLLVLATLAIVITVHRRRAAHAGMIRLVDMDSPATPTTVPSMIATGSTSLRDAK